MEELEQLKKQIEELKAGKKSFMDHLKNASVIIAVVTPIFIFTGWVSAIIVHSIEATSNGYGSSGNVNERLMQTIEKRYAAHGFKVPFLVFWNVNSRNDQQPMSMDQRGFQLVSGCSPSIFTKLLECGVVSAYDLMLEVLNSERYAAITID